LQIGASRKFPSLGGVARSGGVVGIGHKQRQNHAANVCNAPKTQKSRDTPEAFAAKMTKVILKRFAVKFK
jgi:hypothetical protein